MGGRALSNTETRRYSAAEYHAFAEKAVAALREILPDLRIEAVKAYRNKPDFGDLDIVVERSNAKERLEPHLEALGVTEVFRNGPVWSLGWGDFQVDLIFQSSEEFEFATCYFAYNDLGNLMGRTAHSMGFKLGHNGLRYVFREGNHKIAELVLTYDFDKALRFLGYTPVEYARGFDTLEEIFAFAASTMYYDPEPFLLENRSHRARVRDAKRPTYTAFLAYAQQHANEAGFLGSLTQEDHLRRARQLFPDFAMALHLQERQHARNKRVKALFNGQMVSEATGLEGKMLGAFIQQLRKDDATHGGDLNDWILSTDEAARKQWLAENYRRFTERQAQDICA